MLLGFGRLVIVYAAPAESTGLVGVGRRYVAGLQAPGALRDHPNFLPGCPLSGRVTFIESRVTQCDDQRRSQYSDL